MNKFVLYCCLVSGLLSTCSYAMEDDLLKNTEISKKQPGRPTRPLPPIPRKQVNSPNEKRENSLPNQNSSTSLKESASKEENEDKPESIHSSNPTSSPSSKSSSSKGKDNTNILEKRWEELLKKIPSTPQLQDERKKALVDASITLGIVKSAIKSLNSLISSDMAPPISSSPPKTLSQQYKNFKKDIFEWTRAILKQSKEEKDEVPLTFEVKNSGVNNECNDPLHVQFAWVIEKLDELNKRIDTIQDQSIKKEREAIFGQLHSTFLDTAAKYQQSLMTVYAKGNKLNTSESEELKKSQDLAKQKLLEQQMKASTIKEQNTKIDKESTINRLADVGIAVKAVGGIETILNKTFQRKKNQSEKDIPASINRKRTLTPTASQMQSVRNALPPKDEDIEKEKRGTFTPEQMDLLQNVIGLTLIEANKNQSFSEKEYRLLEAMGVVKPFSENTKKEEK